MGASHLHETLRTLGFEEPREVIHRASIADFYPAEERCGIYVLCFASGEIYVGQALNVVRRYAQHRQTYGDIIAIAFKCLSSDSLDAEEQRLIWAFERLGFSLRNITFTSIPKGESDFDLVMPVEEQIAWLRGEANVEESDQRAVHAQLVGRYCDTFARFSKRSNAEKAIATLREYVRCAIPVPERSEVAFWSCSCLPSYNVPGVTLLSRVNIHWQEVFAVSEEQNALQFSLHVAHSSLLPGSGTGLRWLYRRHPRIGVYNHRYKPGGQDQCNLVVDSINSLAALLREARVRHATRVFNLRLMRKGPCNFGRYHCLELADRLLD